MLEKIGYALIAIIVFIIIGLTVIGVSASVLGKGNATAGSALDKVNTTVTQFN